MWAITKVPTKKDPELSNSSAIFSNIGLINSPTIFTNKRTLQYFCTLKKYLIHMYIGIVNDRHDDSPVKTEHTLCRMTSLLAIFLCCTKQCRILISSSKPLNTSQAINIERSTLKSIKKKVVDVMNNEDFVHMTILRL